MNLQPLPVLILSCIVLQLSFGQEDWSYDYHDNYGPRRWGALYSECNGMRQSPIAIDTATSSRKNLGSPLIFRGGSSRPKSMTLTNDKYSCEYKFDFSIWSLVVKQVCPLHSKHRFRLWFTTRTNS